MGEIGIPELHRLQKLPKHWGFVEGLYLGGGDDGIALRLLHGVQYEPVSRALWRKLCAGAELVLDVGAHSGIYTLDAYRAGAKWVVAVEPHPINFGRLVLNVRHAGYSPGGLFYGAAGDADAKCWLVAKGGGYTCSTGGRLGLHNVNGVEYPVKVIRLDSLVPREAWEKVRVVKIDVEGHETRVLGGMEEILGYRPDLIVECIRSGMDDILKPLGYRFWKICETGGIEECADLAPDEKFDENCRNRFASVKGVPDALDRG